VVESSLNGKVLSTIVAMEGVNAPEITIKAAVPIYDNDNNLLGVVTNGFLLDNAFMDGIKDLTDLDVSIYANDTKSATSFVAADGKSRFAGTIEVNEEILRRVLEDQEIFLGVNSVLNTPYLSAYMPLKGYKDETIGMLFTGKPQSSTFTTVQQSINYTFLGSVLLIILSIIPSYLFARFLRENIET
jgi:hypothetical protein